MTIAIPFQGEGVATSGHGRHVRVTINGREVWARAYSHGSATATHLLGLDPRVTVLGWRDTAGPEWRSFDEATRERLLTTIDANAVSWSASFGAANFTEGSARTLSEARASARKAYGSRADGAVVRLYVDSSLVYEEVLDGRRWRDRCIGAL
jgi:hypothetical protein